MVASATSGSPTSGSEGASEAAPQRGGNRPLRIAICGIRGVPAKFGGSETAAEEIGRRLSAAGHTVVVYCRKHNSSLADRTYLGMRRVVLPSVNRFNFDTISHSVLSALHVRLRNTADIIHFHGVGNALVIPLFWGSGKRVVITVDGPDWERPKWGGVARLALKLGARMAARWADHLIIDNHPSVDYFAREFGARGTYVPYGADTDAPTGTGYLRSLGLEPSTYVVFVGALVPDKGPDILLDAYRDVPGDIPLVIVGDSPFFPDYRRRLLDNAARDPRVRMLGYVYGADYRELVANSILYVHPLRSDGTSPALLQAMGFGCSIVVNSNPEALSAVGDAAATFRRDDPRDLSAVLTRLLDDPQARAALSVSARERVLTEYNWDRVADLHASVYRAAGEVVE